MDTPVGEEEVKHPHEHPPKEEYSSDYSRPSTDELLKRSYSYTGGGFGGFLRRDKIVLLVGLSVFLMFLGAVIATMVLVSSPPDRWDKAYDNDDNSIIDGGEYDDYIRDYRDYKGRRDLGLMLGFILLEFGVLIMGFALVGGAISNRDLDKNVRLGMLISAGIIIGLEIFFMASMMSIPAYMGLSP
jgi:hypothetical protein